VKNHLGSSGKEDEGPVDYSLSEPLWSEFLGYVIGRLFVQFACDIPSFLRKQESSNLSWVPASTGTTVTQSNNDRPGSRFGMASELSVSWPNGQIKEFFEGGTGETFLHKKVSPVYSSYYGVAV
jgi:hypothetical protein